MDNKHAVISLYNERKGSASQKELADLEHRLWVLHNLSVAGPRGTKRDWLFAQLGGTRYDYEIRATLLAAGKNVDKLWDKINDGMPGGTAVRLFRKAKKISASEKIPLDKAVDKVVDEYNSLSETSVSVDGRVLKKAAPYAKQAVTNELPEDIRQVKKYIAAIISNYISKQNLDSFSLNEAGKELTVWIDEGLELFNKKINKLRSEDKDSKLLKIGKTRFIQAIEIIGLKPSDYLFGKPINLKAAKKSYFARVKLLHPDRTGGSKEKEVEYMAVTEAFHVLEQYAEQIGDSSK